MSGFGGWVRWAYDPSVWRYEIRAQCTHGFRLHLGFDPDVTADAIDTAIREITRRMLRRHNR